MMPPFLAVVHEPSYCVKRDGVSNMLFTILSMLMINSRTDFRMDNRWFVRNYEILRFPIPDTRMSIVELYVDCDHLPLFFTWCQSLYQNHDRIFWMFVMFESIKMIWIHCNLQWFFSSAWTSDKTDTAMNCNWSKCRMTLSCDFWEIPIVT